MNQELLATEDSTNNKRISLTLTINLPAKTEEKIKENHNKLLFKHKLKIESISIS